MTFAAPAVPIHQERIARGVDNGTMGEFRASLAGSSPGHWVLVPQTVLEQYKQMISALEVELKNHRTYVAQLMAQQGHLSEEISTEPSEGLDAASAALVNSLLCTVPDNNYYRDEEAE